VRLSDGSQHRADIVVSAADGHGTIFDMLGGRYVDDKIKRRYSTWKMVRPTLIVTFGVAREFAGEPWLTITRLARPITIGHSGVEALSVRLFNYSPCFAPTGRRWCRR